MTAKAKPVKSNAPKDPDAPRKPLSAFFLFCGKERAVVQKELSSLNGAAVTRELGKRWALLDDKAKEVFEKASVEDKKRYEDGMKSYKPSEEFLKMKAAYEAKVKTPIAAVVTNPVDQIMTKQNPVEEYFCHLLLNWREVTFRILYLVSKDLELIKCPTAKNVMVLTNRVACIDSDQRWKKRKSWQACLRNLFSQAVLIILG